MTGVVFLGISLKHLVVISRETTVGSDEKSPKHLVVISTRGRNLLRKDQVLRGYLVAALPSI
jgi:hypothetical protein